MARQVGDLIVYLNRQLASWRNDQGPRLISKCWSVGSRKAAVLPVPVGAQAIKSRPSNAAGIAWA
jgi:hypothetical protein